MSTRLLNADCGLLPPRVQEVGAKDNVLGWGLWAQVRLKGSHVYTPTLDVARRDGVETARYRIELWLCSVIAMTPEAAQDAARLLIG